MTAYRPQLQFAFASTLSSDWRSSSRGSSAASSAADLEEEALFESLFTDRSSGSCPDGDDLATSPGNSLDDDDLRGCSRNGREAAGSFDDQEGAADALIADFMRSYGMCEPTTNECNHQTDDTGYVDLRVLTGMDPISPPRPSKSAVASLFASAGLSPNTRNASHDALSNNSIEEEPACRDRVVQFDVGGRLFRCKASIIAKYPGKRLDRIVNCGCDRFQGSDTFFIDRSARHFEVILDWYRTGKVFCPSDVSLEALKLDARYFDVYDEMFPVKAEKYTKSDTKQSVTTLAKLKQAHQPSKEHGNPTIGLSHPEYRTAFVQAGPSDSRSTFRFSKLERRTVTPDCPPVVFYVRKYEQLAVASVEGHGKLLLRACDATGMLVVHVDQAVLFDSKSRFYLGGARANLPVSNPLPGDYVYTFWMEKHADSGEWRQNDSVDTRADPRLEVEFQLISSYSQLDRVEAQMESGSANESAQGNNAAGRHETASDNQSTFSAGLFLPPMMQPSNEGERSEKIKPPPASKVENSSSHVPIAQMSTISFSSLQDARHLEPDPQMQTNTAMPSKKSKYIQRDIVLIPTPSLIIPAAVNRVTQSPIRRTGAAIAQSKPSIQKRQEGKITIHRSDKLGLLCDGEPPASRKPEPHSSIVPRPVGMALHDFQPRLFR